MGERRAVDRFGSGIEQRRCRGPKGGARRGDIVNQQQPPPSSAGRGLEAASWKGKTGSAAVPGLPAQAATSKGMDDLPTEEAPGGVGHEPGGGPRAAPSVQRVRRNVAHAVDLVGPILGGDGRTEAFGERTRQIIAAAVFQGQNGGS